MTGYTGLRGRLALLCAAAVALAVAAVSALAYLATASAMQTQIDNSLLDIPVPERNARLLLPSPAPVGSVPGAGVADQLCGSGAQAQSALAPVVGAVQLVSADGTVCAATSLGQVAATPGDLAVARGESTGGLRDDVTDDGVPVRVRTQPVAGGGRDYALLVMRDTRDVEATLRRLKIALAVGAALGGLAALGAGWLVARASLQPLDGLTAAAEHIAATQDLDVPIEVSGSDEIARLAGAFNQMTAALSASRGRQQQLVADASHELRTPLTSLRTNIELLARVEATGRPLPAGQRREVLDSVVAQIAELADLVTELTVLARDDVPGERAAARAPVDVVAVVERAADRAGRRGDHEISTRLFPWTVIGDAPALERAVLNVLDNAVKFSPAGSRVSVTLADGVLDVDDQGPGIRPAERSLVLDRFWRSPSARGVPGSGLGLAIVADAVAGHGGSVEILDAPAGGTRVRIRLPGSGHPRAATVDPGMA